MRTRSLLKNALKAITKVFLILVCWFFTHVICLLEKDSIFYFLLPLILFFFVLWKQFFRCLKMWIYILWNLLMRNFGKSFSFENVHFLTKTYSRIFKKMLFSFKIMFLALEVCFFPALLCCIISAFL